MNRSDESSKAVVMVHVEWGVFIGSAMGLSFWSKLDPVGQDHAAAFSSAAEAEEYVATWDDPPKAEALSFVGVVGARDAHGNLYASMQACVAAGAAPWMDDATPVANAFPS